MGLRAEFDQARGLAEAGLSGEALAIFDRLVSAYPAHRETRFNCALMLAQLQRHEEAIEQFDWLVRNGCGSLYPAARFSRGFSSLMLGNYRAGFIDFEYRKIEAAPPNLEWDGSTSIDGKAVLVTGEMGYGDSIMFSRYLPMLRHLGARVTVSVPPALNPLMAAIPGIAAVSSIDKIPRCEVQVRMMSLALAFGTDIGTVPPPPRFDLPRLHKTGRVGLCWSSGRKSGYESRNVPLEMLGPLLDIPGLEFCSLQVGVRGSDVAASRRFNLADMGAVDFLRTATAISGMDLVVTVDTAVAHLSGSLGIPTWILLSPFREYWLWQHAGRWYPTVRCFRQDKVGDWRPVIERVTGELRNREEGKAR